MHRGQCFHLLLVALLTLSGCGPASSSSTSSEPSSHSPVLGQHLLVKVTGSLAYKRAGWQEYLPLTFGIALRPGDLLRVANDGEGLLVCADLSLVPLRGGYEGGLPCTEREPVLQRGESLVLAPQRGAAQLGSLPYLLRPRRTFVREPHPLIRWAPGSGAGGVYSVRVWGGDVDWTTDTAATELRYPDDAPTLQPGIPYRVTIVDSAGGTSTDEDAALDLSFVLLAPEQSAQVEALLAQAQGLGLDDRGRRFLEAEIEAAQGLRADALDHLEELARLDGSPTVWLRLGDLYQEVGLYAEAASAYEWALAGFRTVGDRSGEAKASTGLGMARRGEGDLEAARRSLTGARELYLALGEADGVKQVERLLSAIP